MKGLGITTCNLAADVFDERTERLDAFEVCRAEECRIPNMQDSLDRLLLISDSDNEQQYDHTACNNVETGVFDDYYGLSSVSLRKRGDGFDDIAKIERGYARH